MRACGAYVDNGCSKGFLPFSRYMKCQIISRGNHTFADHYAHPKLNTVVWVAIIAMNTISHGGTHIFWF